MHHPWDDLLDLLALGAAGDPSPRRARAATHVAAYAALQALVCAVAALALARGDLAWALPLGALCLAGALHLRHALRRLATASPPPHRSENLRRKLSA